MTRLGRDVSRAETPSPLTNAVRPPVDHPDASKAGHIGAHWATEGPTGWTAGTGRLSSGLEHVTFITCSKHPCHSLLFDVPRLPLPRPVLFLFETSTLRLALSKYLSSSSPLSHFYTHHRDITASPHLSTSHLLYAPAVSRQHQLNPIHVTSLLNCEA